MSFIDIEEFLKRKKGLQEQNIASRAGLQQQQELAITKALATGELEVDKDTNEVRNVLAKHLALQGVQSDQIRQLLVGINVNNVKQYFVKMIDKGATPEEMVQYAENAIKDLPQLAEPVKEIVPKYIEEIKGEETSKMEDLRARRKRAKKKKKPTARLDKQIEQVKTEIDKLDATEKKLDQIIVFPKGYLGIPRDVTMGEYKERSIIQLANELGVDDFTKLTKRVKLIESLAPETRKSIYGVGKIRGGKFMGMAIDIPALARHKLVVDGRPFKDIDDDAIELLTKRFNPKKDYSPQSRQTFRELVFMSGKPYSKRQMGGKYSLLEQKVVGTADELVEQLGLKIGSLMAGNDSIILKNEINQISDQLLKWGVIDKAKHRRIYEQYIR